MLRLSQIDLENEQKSFNLAYENAEIDQQKKNSFTGITARYNKIKKILSHKEIKQVKELRKKDTSSASAFSLLAQHLLLSFKEMWHAGWTIQYKNRVKENAYFSKDELNRFNLTESEVIDFFFFVIYEPERRAK